MGGLAVVTLSARTGRGIDKLLPAVFAAHLRDIPVTIVAPGILWRTAVPFSLLQVAPDSPYRTGADLEGAVVISPSAKVVADELYSGRFATGVQIDLVIRVEQMRERKRCMRPAEAELLQLQGTQHRRSDTQWVA